MWLNESGMRLNESDLIYHKRKVGKLPIMVFAIGVLQLGKLQVPKPQRHWCWVV